MRGNVLKGLAVVGLFALMGASVATAATPKLRAEIPFNFVAGNTLLRSGTYTVSEEQPGVLVIRNDAGREAAVVVARLVDARQPQEGAKLIFTHYGNRYFLREVGNIASFPDYVIPASREETRMRQELGGGSRHASEIAVAAAFR